MYDCDIQKIAVTRNPILKGLIVKVINILKTKKWLQASELINVGTQNKRRIWVIRLGLFNKLDKYSIEAEKNWIPPLLI